MMKNMRKSHIERAQPRRQAQSSPLSALGLEGCLVHSISVETDKPFGKSRDDIKYCPVHHFPSWI